MSAAAGAMSRKERKGKARAAAQEEKPTAAMPLGKQLAHTDKKVRDRAIANLVAFLSRGSRGESSTYVKLEDAEMAKLWKGLFYCFWMSDKPLVQQALAADLAELVLLINPAEPAGASEEDVQRTRFGAAVAFLEGFWASMVREWEGLDKHRMDKFYLLIRRFVNATFRLLARQGWSAEAIQTMNELLLRKGSGPLSWHDRRVPISLAMHLSDVFLEELDKVLALPEVDSQPACPLRALLQPYMSLLANTPSQIVHDRLSTTLFRPLLDALALASPSADLEARAKKRTKRDEPMFAHIVMRSTAAAAASAPTEPAASASAPDKIRPGVIQGMFQEAAKEGSVESNRRKVYKLYREEGGDDNEDDDE